MLCGLTLINKRYSIARREMKEKGGVFEVLHLNPFRQPQTPAAEGGCPEPLICRQQLPTSLNRDVQEISQVF